MYTCYFKQQNNSILITCRCYYFICDGSQQFCILFLGFFFFLATPRGFAGSQFSDQGLNLGHGSENLES